VGGLYAIGGGVATEGALWKLGNKGLRIILVEVYVREGDWGLFFYLDFPCAAYGTCVSGVPTLANI
jgi:hypothetical protein